MKKQILFILVSLLTVSSAFAEREMSKLQYVETQSCSSEDLQRTIRETANRVMFDDTNLTTLESGLGIKTAEKTSGIHAEVYKIAPLSSVSKHAKSVARAEEDARAGRVGVTVPARFDVVYRVVDKDGQQIGNKGRVQIDVACRVETRTADGREYLRHASQLIAFEVKPKGVK